MDSLAQFEESLTLLLAPPADQNAWVDATGFPAEEIALQYYDTMHQLRWLREQRLIDDADEIALGELNEFVQGAQTRLFIDRAHFVDGWYVADAPEWHRVRELAARALTSLHRPVTEKTPGT